MERWVPQAAVMRIAAVTVGHGGAGSVLSALAAGVPMEESRFRDRAQRIADEIRALPPVDAAADAIAALAERRQAP